MPIDHVLAVVPVADFEAAHAWYERLFGRPADNLPMEGRLVEWRVTDSGWVQVTRDAARAQLSAIRDPEGNTITFIGNFRVQY
jgi:glyoxylase I family protein